MTDVSKGDKRRGKNGQLPEIEGPETGIPTFVFSDGATDVVRPTADKKSLEVTLVWKDSPLSIGHYPKPRTIYVGDDVKNDFRIACNGLTTQRFPLLEDVGGAFVVNWTEKMALEVQTEGGDVLAREELEAAGKAKKLPDGRYQYQIGLHDRVAVQVDQITFVLRYVSPGRVVKTSIAKSIDYYFTMVLGFVFLVHTFVLLALLLTPEDPLGVSEDLFQNPNRFAQLILKEPEKKKDAKRKFELEGAKQGGKHKDKEGKFGKIDKPQRDALASTKGAPRVDPNKREKDRKIAMDSGIFAALKGQGGAVSDVFGPGGLGSGINNALGGLRGTGMGDAGGVGGLGSRGTGPGGGGNSLGIGGLGGGSGYGSGMGLGSVDLGGRGKDKFSVIPGRTVTKGCLTNEVVLRVLNRVQSQAKYCYEKELPKNPNLEGKVTTRFTIGPTGAVQAADISETTMGNTEVENCLVRVVQRLRFPPCAGGGVAEVTYPWIFKSGGGSQ